MGISCSWKGSTNVPASWRFEQGSLDPAGTGENAAVEAYRRPVLAAELVPFCPVETTPGWTVLAMPVEQVGEQLRHSGG